MTAQSCTDADQAVSGKYKAQQAVCFHDAVILMIAVKVVLIVAGKDDSLSSNNFVAELMEEGRDTDHAQKHSHC